MLSALCLLLLAALSSSAFSSEDCMTIWLTSIGIPSTRSPGYVQLLVREAVSERSLELMSMEQLEAVGIEPSGPRSLIFNAAQSGIEVCKFGGTCDPENLTYSCSCQAGLSGHLCQEATIDCPVDLCLNGGSCYRNETTVSCTCASGYSGDRCQNAAIEGKIASLESQLYQLSLQFQFFQHLQISLSGDVTELKRTDGYLTDLMRDVHSPRLFLPWNALTRKSIVDLTYLPTTSHVFLMVLTAESPQVVQVYDTRGEAFTLLQEISLSSKALDMTSFVMDKALDLSCVVVAAGRSFIYCWNATERAFEKWQEIETRGAEHVESTSVGPEATLWLAFSSSGDADTSLYVLSGQRFYLFQYIPTNGSANLSLASSAGDGQTFMSVGQQDPASVAVYALNSLEFTHIQQLNCFSSYMFVAGRFFFMIASGVMYRYDSIRGLFVPHTTLPDTNATAYQYFPIGLEHYIVIGSPLAGEGNQTSSDVNIYRFTGVNFELHQTISIPGRISKIYEFRGGDGRHAERKVLALLNEDGNAYLYRWNSYIK